MKDNKIEEAVARLKAAFVARGYEDCPFCRSWNEGDKRRAFLYRKDRSSEVYLGTYLNECSIKDLEGMEGRPPLWKDLVGQSAAVVGIEPVYRHNGTAEDASVEVRMHYYDAKPRKWYPPDDFRSDEYKAMVKAESPTDYCANGWEWTTNSVVNCPRIVKFRADGLTERKLANIVAKVDGIVGEWKCPDYSALAEDRSKWHKDTTDAHNRWWDKKHKEEKKRTA